MISRRDLYRYGLAFAGAAAASKVVPPYAAIGAAAPQGKRFEVTKTDDEWRRILTPEQYAVLRQQGTERPRSSPLDNNEASGLYQCAGCGLPLFSSKTKFHSGTGWPSFWKPLDGAVETSADDSHMMVRTEVHCRRCGGHLGHVFEDGPPPTGLRYCMNGVALNFLPKSDGPSGRSD